MEFNQISRWLIFLCIGLITAGIFFWLLNKISSVKNIPGTLELNVGELTCVFPILLSIILSIVLTIVLNLVSRFLNK